VDDRTVFPSFGDHCKSILADSTICFEVDVNGFQQPFCWIYAVWNIHADRCEMRGHVRNWAGVAQLALSQKMYFVE